MIRIMDKHNGEKLWYEKMDKSFVEKTKRDPNIDDKIFPPNTNITIYLEIEPETRLLIEYNST